MADDQSWACKQVPNGQNPIVVCEREALRDEIVRLRAVLDAIDAHIATYVATATFIMEGHWTEGRHNAYMAINALLHPEAGSDE